MLSKIEEERIVVQVMQRFAALLQESFADVPIVEPEYLSPEMVHQNFSIDEATVRSWVRRGDIEGVQGRPFLVKTKSQRKYLASK